MKIMFSSQEVVFSKREVDSCMRNITNGITGDNGSISFWDWKSGHRFQSLDTTAQPGSLEAESGLMSSIYDRTGLRLICGEADKTSKFPIRSVSE